MKIFSILILIFATSLTMSGCQSTNSKSVNSTIGAGEGLLVANLIFPEREQFFHVPVKLEYQGKEVFGALTFSESDDSLTVISMPIGKYKFTHFKVGERGIVSLRHKNIEFSIKEKKATYIGDISISLGKQYYSKNFDGDLLLRKFAVNVKDNFQFVEENLRANFSGLLDSFVLEKEIAEL